MCMDREVVGRLEPPGAKTGEHVIFPKDLDNLKAALAIKIRRALQCRIGFETRSGTAPQRQYHVAAIEIDLVHLSNNGALNGYFDGNGAF